jgi:tetratricopeptide (TPR) repeat protein
MEEMNRPAEAEAAYRRALVLWFPLATDLGHKNPVYLASLEKFHKRLFALLEYGGKSEAARAVCGQLLAPLEEAAAKAPDDVDVQLRLADALYFADGLMIDTGQIEEGHKLGDRAVRLYDKLPGSMRQMLVSRYARQADLLESRNRFAEAEIAHRKIVELEPDGIAYYELGKFLLDQKKEGEAIAVYKKALVAVPSYNFLRMELAWLLANCSDVRFRDSREAVVVAKKTVELDPTDERSFKVLGTALYRTGDWEAASAALEKFMEAYGGGDSAAWFFLAMAKWQLGENDAAREWYGRAVESMQKNQPEHFVRFQNNADLIRFRSEAAALLGVNEAQPQAASVPFPATNPAASGPSARLNIPKAKCCKVCSCARTSPSPSPSPSPYYLLDPPLVSSPSPLIPIFYCHCHTHFYSSPPW